MQLAVKVIWVARFATRPNESKASPLQSRSGFEMNGRRPKTRHQSSTLLTITSNSDSVKRVDALAGIGLRPPSYSSGAMGQADRSC
jgi:hypothetical protein